MSGTSPRANPSGMRINGSNFLIIVSRFLLCGSRGAAELQNWCSIATHTSRPSGASFQRRQLALLELGSRFMHRPKEFRPILKVSRENLLHQLSSQLRHEVVQHDGRVSSFIG